MLAYVRRVNTCYTPYHEGHGAAGHALNVSIPLVTSNNVEVILKVV
jgi:hypothetical protein